MESWAWAARSCSKGAAHASWEPVLPSRRYHGVNPFRGLRHLTFIILYGSLSLVFLASWIYEAAKVVRDTYRLAPARLERAGALVGATVVATALVGILIAQGSLTF